MKQSTYLFNRGCDMIDLALEIQTQVYWGGSFWCLNTEESVPWRQFWEYLRSYDAEGYNGVRIFDNGDVNFIKVA